MGLKSDRQKKLSNRQNLTFSDISNQFNLFASICLKNVRRQNKIETRSLINLINRDRLKFFKQLHSAIS